MTIESFRGLFREGRTVVIPMLQRDYAQGRTDPRSHAILVGFLDSLVTVLRDPDAEPLDLDFIYGRLDGGALEPLDGQQRLTTLFLLHWYLAQRDGCQADFQSWMRHGERSCFGYRTRPSAEEFIDELVGQAVDVTALPDSPKALSEWIADRPWFLRAWRRDPTVSGCLTALDVMHSRFRGLTNGYAQLVEADAPRVSFHLLELGDFKLSDELYIKMNARGKPLTPFEVFKAELEQHIEQAFSNEPCPHAADKTWKQYTSERLDREWTDFLWHHKDEHSEIDPRFLQLLRAIVVIHWALQASTDESTLGPQLQSLLTEPEPDLHFYGELECLNRDFVERLVRLLDILASCPDGKLCFLGRADYFDENAALEALLRFEGRHGMSLPDWAKLAAYGMFLLARAGDLHTEAARTAGHEWMRIVCNLVNNSDIDHVDRLATALQSLAAMHELGAGDQFLDHIAADDVFGRGFNRDQQVEERLKAELIRSAASWRPIIERAEAHTYFFGDLQFLLRSSNLWDKRGELGAWSNEAHESHQQSLTCWYERVCAVFPPNRAGLGELGAPEEFLWQRALLIHGDYLLRSRSNMCLLHDRHRDASWKRLLRGDHAERRAIVQRVLEAIDPGDAVASLEAIVKRGPAEDTDMWRRLLATDPRLIAECGRRMLRFEDHTVYLLRNLQRNGYHVDLYVFALYLEIIDRLRRGALAGFRTPEAPRIRGAGKRCKLQLKPSRGGGALDVTTEQMQQVFRVRVRDRWVDALSQAGWAQDGKEWVRRVPLELGEATLFDFITIVTERSVAPEV